jgi:hypothetical protein
MAWKRLWEVTCDRCPRRGCWGGYNSGRGYPTLTSAQHSAREAGWSGSSTSWRCPECRERAKKKVAA